MEEAEIAFKRELIRHIEAAHIYVLEHLDDIDGRLMDVENQICHLFTIYGSYLPLDMIERIETLRFEQRTVRNIYRTLGEMLCTERARLFSETEVTKPEDEAKGGGQ